MDASSSFNCQRHLALVDIFRLLINSNEQDQIHSDLSSLSSDDNPSPNNPGYRNDALKLSLLNMRPRLVDKKIIESSDINQWDKLQEILFERLMIENYDNFETIEVVIPKNKSQFLFVPPDSSELSIGIETQILKYLYGCYYRLQSYVTAINSVETDSAKNKDYDAFLQNVKTNILNQLILYLTEIELFPDREKRTRNNIELPLLLNLVLKYYPSDPSHTFVMKKFISDIGEACENVGQRAYDAVIDPTYNRLCQKFSTIPLDDVSLINYFEVLMIFLQHPEFTSKIMQKISIKVDSSFAYQSTLLGYMLCISNLPRPSQIQPRFFLPGSLETHRKSIEVMLGMKLNAMGEELYKVFHAFLKCPKTKEPFLKWIGRCLHTFKDRKKLWSNQILMTTTTISVNDGFLLNFLSAMLHLCEPFAGPFTSRHPGQETHIKNKRMLKINPVYCKLSQSDPEISKAHMLGLASETFLVQTTKEASNVIEDERKNDVNFISECFFGTHLAISFGFRSVYERFFKLTQSINELQQNYSDIMQQSLSSPDATNLVEMIKEKLDQSMSTFTNLKTVLLEPKRLKMQFHFCLATADYLNHLASCETYQEAVDSNDYKIISLKDLREGKLSKVNLEYIPEMLVENILDLIISLFLFGEEHMRNEMTDHIESIMTSVIIFMGNSRLIQNPHLRARFAEILEYMMPHTSHITGNMVGCAHIFEHHPLIEELVPSLVNVFVSIEMTGEGVQFEQKFSYRRPMYVVLKYLWDLEKHRAVLIKMAIEAERDIESSRPPLLLRFINLLMNDAIFLLDEALGYMNQLKEAERRKRSEEWVNLSAQQRAQAEATYSHIGRLARFHNVLSLSTIGTLAWMTSEIKSIFCHPTLVDRIANMLNYFLENLVGDKRKNFNVNDKNDFEFKPKLILEKICQIYVNLGDESNSRCAQFCTAVSSDGRSYHANLLPGAAEILFRTGLSSLGSEFETLSKLVHKIAVQNELDEIPTDNIPEAFLDPIMSTLMRDPVLLPSSKIIVDRSTIARHLLSDQTDPFNRSPLSMEQVIPEVNLKNQILTFLRERRESKR